MADPRRRVDLVADFARPLPMDVICDLVGIPDHDRPTWRIHGAAIAAGHGPAFVAAIPDIIAGAKAAVADRRAAGHRATGDSVAGEGSTDLLAHLIRLCDEEGDRLSDVELVSLVWHLVLAGQTPANLITSALLALMEHPEQLALLRREPERMPAAVEELTRWCAPQLLTVPRFATEDVDVHGTTVPRGAAVVVAIAAVNRDPRVFGSGLDVTRPPAQHLAYGHGPHYCLGAALARVQTELALTALIRANPVLAGDVVWANDLGTARIAELPVELETPVLIN